MEAKAGAMSATSTWRFSIDGRSTLRVGDLAMISLRSAQLSAADGIEFRRPIVVALSPAAAHPALTSSMSPEVRSETSRSPYASNTGLEWTPYPRTVDGDHSGIRTSS